MTAEQFRDLVRHMRDAQKKYFATRDPLILSQSKELEREVDAELRDRRQSTFLQEQTQ